MSIIEKITKTNWLPRQMGVFCTAEKFNELVDQINGGTLLATSLALTGNLTVDGISTFNGTIVLGDAAADSLTVNATTTYTDPINFSNETGIIAGATQTQAGATALTEEINNVSTCTTAGDGVKLPAAVAGKHVRVKNSGAAILTIYPATADSINALAVNLAVQISKNAVIDFYAKDATVWESSYDETISLLAPSTLKGGLGFKAIDNTGNYIVAIRNAVHGQSSDYTIPDSGVSASFVMTEGTQTINGVKTFGSVINAPIGSAVAPTYAFTGQLGMGMYESSATELGFATAGVFRGRFSALGGLEVASPGITNTLVSALSVIKKPSGTTVVANTGVTLTAAMMLSGYVMVTGTTGSLVLDSVANITAALGTSPEGTTFEFTLNTMGTTSMTAGNVVTITAPANCTFMKQFNTTDAASDFIPTVTATAGVHLGTFRVTYSTATTIVVQRIG